MASFVDLWMECTGEGLGGRHAIADLLKRQFLFFLK